MAYKVVKKDVFECKCEVCKHEWTTLKLPRFCANCKTSAWNGYKRDKKA